jgi:PAS domain-containing protein
MPVSGGWMRKWRGAHDERERASALIRAAARGDSLDQMLDLGVQTLLEAAAGDRAGLWLVADRRGESDLGRVIEAKPGPVPEQWKHLDISTPFLRTALESPNPLRVDLDTDASVPHLGPLVGMRSAVWIPLLARNCTFGLAMVAHAHAGANPDLEVLRARAEEIALAVGHHRDTRRATLAAEELRAQLRLSRAILCGVSADSILPQIARAARIHVQAEFVTLGEGGVPPASGEAWDGLDDWRKLLQQDPLLQLWRRVFEEGRESDIVGETIPVDMRSASNPSHAMLDRVIAVPIEARKRTFGVLMAGFQASENSNEDFARLESYAQVAASALDREFAREECAACKKSLRQIIEDSGECLVAIDEKGTIREASRAAVMLLFPPWVRRQEMALEDFFSPAAREAVAQWRNRITSPDSALALKSERPLAPLEAALHHGSIVRLHLRSTISGLGARHGDAISDGAALWLLHFENQDEHQALRDTEMRLEAEMAGLLDSIESGILLLDVAGNIRMVSDRLAAILGCESRRLFELGTIEALMDSLANQLVRLAETVARWREHVRRGDEASWDEFELNRPSRKIGGTIFKARTQA